VFPALRASRVPPIAALRTVAVEPKPPVIRIVIGIGVVALGVVNLVGGLTQGGDAALAGVGGGALFIFIGVAILGPAFARPVVRLLAWPLPRLRGITGTLARENASRNPRRTSTTAAALMIGVALVGFIAIFAASAKASIDQIIDESFSGDLIIDSGQFVNGGISTDLADAVRVTPGVAASTGVRFLTANLDLPDASTPAGPTGDAAFVLGADTTALSEITDPQLTSGRVSGLELDEVAVATTVAEGAGLAVGDSVTARFPTGERTLTVTGTFDNRALLGDWMVDLATADAATVDRLDVQVWVKVADDASVATVQDELKVVAEPWPTAQVLDLTEFKASQAEQFDQLLNLVYALLGLAVLIALVGIANTLALSVYERTREMGLMRAVGMDRRQLRAVVRWESVVIAVFGTLLGLVIGLFFGWVMVLALSEQGLGVLSIPVGTLAVVMVLSGLAGVVAALLPARRAGRLNVLTAIGSE
jgi:putative ABC transport system permease protein